MAATESTCMGKSPVLVVCTQTIKNPGSVYVQLSRPWKHNVIPAFEDAKNSSCSLKRRRSEDEAETDSHKKQKVLTMSEELFRLTNADYKAAIHIPSPILGTFKIILSGRVYVRVPYNEIDKRILDFSPNNKGNDEHEMVWCRYDCFGKSGLLLKNAACKSPEPVLEDMEFRGLLSMEHTSKASKNIFSSLPMELRAEIYDLVTSTGDTSVAAAQERLTNLQCVSRFMYEDVSTWAYNRHWLLFTDPRELLAFLDHVAQSPKLNKSVKFGKITLKVDRQSRKFSRSNYAHIGREQQWCGDDLARCGIQMTEEVGTVPWAYAVQQLLKIHTVDVLEIYAGSQWWVPGWLVGHGPFNAQSPFIQSLLQFEGGDRISHLLVGVKKYSQGLEHLSLRLLTDGLGYALENESDNKLAGVIRAHKASQVGNQQGLEQRKQWLADIKFREHESDQSIKGQNEMEDSYERSLEYTKEGLERIRKRIQTRDSEHMKRVREERAWRDEMFLDWAIEDGDFDTYLWNVTCYPSRYQPKCC